MKRFPVQIVVNSVFHFIDKAIDLQKDIFIDVFNSGCILDVKKAEKKIAQAIKNNFEKRMKERKG